MSAHIQPVLLDKERLDWRASYNEKYGNAQVHLDVGSNAITLIIAADQFEARFVQAIAAAHKLAGDLDLIADQLGFGECAKCEQYRIVHQPHPDADELVCDECQAAIDEEGRDAALENAIENREYARATDGPEPF